MKHNSILITMLFWGLCASAQVGVHTDFPDNSSAMDIYASDKGLLIPRIVLTSSLSNPSPVTSPATGLLIFNSGSNQTVGFYFWDGSQWVPLNEAPASTDYWSLYGNSGTTVGPNFIGTPDDEDFALYTNESERMRLTEAGNVIIGQTTPNDPTDLFSVIGKPGWDYTINAYSPFVSYYAEAGYSGLISSGGLYGLFSIVDTIDGLSIFGINENSEGYAAIFAGSDVPGYVLEDHTAGLSASGTDGVFAVGDDANGIGVIAIGNALDTASTIESGSGGAFTGYDGIYAIGVDFSGGTGVLGVGNNMPTFSSHPDGSGGAFSGYHGIYGVAANSTEGTGVIAAGNGESPYTFSDGGGGFFTGTYTGVAGFGLSTDYGLGGYFDGGDGILAASSRSSNGTGVIGIGNNGSSYYINSNGSGGAFTGSSCGVYCYATNSSGNRYGGFFGAGGSSSYAGYAYVGGRFNNTRCKIIGLGTVNTIVKNTKGELVALTCPEAPEMLFQDFGIGQLVDGKAHITIDPDLAINIVVNEVHPLKVYITPEGECNGVYVTNKSNQGFDVVEFKGGKSNVSFSWQIVATRANEQYTRDDGSIEISDYSYRFPPAPGPLGNVAKSRQSEGVRQIERKNMKVNKVIKTKTNRVETPKNRKSSQ